MKVQAIRGTVEVANAVNMDGVGILEVPVEDYADFRALPHGVVYEEVVYGKAGWNSDRRMAYYRTDRHVATAIVAESGPNSIIREVK